MSWLKAKTRFQAAFGSGEDPHLVATSFAVGVGLGLSPFLGLHTVLALGFASLLRLNKKDVLLGTLVINPWTLPPYWFAANKLGSWLTGLKPKNPAFAWEAPGVSLAFLWQDNGQWFGAEVANWFLGALLLAVIGAFGIYFGLYHLIHHRRGEVREEVS